MVHGADANDSQGPVLAAKSKGDQRFQSRFINLFSSLRIPLLIDLQKLAVALHHLLRPGLHDGEFGMAAQVGFVKSNGCAGHELRRISLAFLEADDAVRGAKTFN